MRLLTHNLCTPAPIGDSLCSHKMSPPLHGEVTLHDRGPLCALSPPGAQPPRWLWAGAEAWPASRRHDSHASPLSPPAQPAHAQHRAPPRFPFALAHVPGVMKSLPPLWGCYSNGRRGRGYGGSAVVPGGDRAPPALFRAGEGPRCALGGGRSAPGRCGVLGAGTPTRRGWGRAR